MILRGLKKVFFYHYNIFFIKSQFSGFFWAIWRGARSTKNFAYGYTDREIGPGRPTPARPAPSLLYHKPQALSIGILHKNWERFYPLPILMKWRSNAARRGNPTWWQKRSLAKNFLILQNPPHLLRQRLRTRSQGSNPPFPASGTNQNPLRCSCLACRSKGNCNPTLGTRKVYSSSSSSGSSLYSQGAGQLGSAWQIFISS